jgi:hypothetical protein
MSEHPAKRHADHNIPAETMNPHFRWPNYLVTAPHSVCQAPGSDHPRVPYGEWHARRVGSMQTACGRAAVTWQFFWTLVFAKAGTRACPECVRALGHETCS